MSNPTQPNLSFVECDHGIWTEHRICDTGTFCSTEARSGCRRVSAPISLKVLVMELIGVSMLLRVCPYTSDRFPNCFIKASQSPSVISSIPPTTVPLFSSATSGCLSSFKLSSFAEYSAYLSTFQQSFRVTHITLPLLSRPAPRNVCKLITVN